MFRNGQRALIAYSDLRLVLPRDIARKRPLRALTISSAAACADFISGVEDDPDWITSLPFAEVESRWVRRARHRWRISLRAVGVTKSLPAIRSAVNDPFAISVRKDRTVNGPSGQNTAAASTSVISSSSRHSSGRARFRARTRGSRRGILSCSGSAIGEPGLKPSLPITDLQWRALRILGRSRGC